MIIEDINIFRKAH